VEKLAAVSVVAEFCVIAGSASTIGMLKDAQGPQWLKELGLPHIWIGVDGTVGAGLPAIASATPR
jgi:thiamine biosynthesis lipoprotein